MVGKKGKGGRPRRTEEQTKRVGFEATADEIDEIDARAASYGLSRSEFLRRRALFVPLPRRQQSPKRQTRSKRRS